MPRSPSQQPIKQILSYTDIFKRKAVQMMLDGHSPQSSQERLGLPKTALLYRWRKQQREKAGPVGAALDARVKELEAKFHRVKRERDVLEKCVNYFRPRRLKDIYAAADTIILDQVGSEREVNQFLGFSRPNFQCWKGFFPGCREKSEDELLPLVISIFYAHRKRYGARRIVQELHHRGFTCCRERVAKLLKIAGLKALQQRLGN